MADTAPQRIGKYQITALLGQGAMGVVYLGRDPLLGRSVAIKVMSQGIATDQELRDRFLREARAAGSLQHPNIITIYDFGEADGSLYIAMEYVEGSDLSEIMARHDPLPVTGKIAIIIDALHALDYAHSRGVVHRDVKPANIRVSVDGHAKLMDFGIARLEKSDLTRSGIMIGTPDYMAPEQVTGGQISPATDVFAVGVVLYEFLSGHRTFDGETIHAVLYKVVSEQPPPLRDVTQGVPASLQPILDRALAKDVGHRYRSAGDMARDLEVVHRALSGGATVRVEARSTPLHTARLSRPPGLAKRRRRRVLAFAGLGLVVVGGVAAALLGVGRTRSPHPAPAPGATAAGTTAAPGAALPGGQVMESVAVGRAAAAPGAESAAAPAPLAATPREAQHPTVTADVPTPKRAARQAAAAEPQGVGRAFGGRRRAPVSEAQAAVALVQPTPQRPPPPAESVAVPVPSPSPTSGPAPAGAQGAGPLAGAKPPVPAPAAAESTHAPARPPAPPNPRPGLEALVAAYARAIEGRNVAEIRRLYPGLTDQQERAWRQLFANVRNLDVSLGITELDAHGPTADLTVNGTYVFNYEGRTQRQQIGFRATAAQASAGGSWLFSTIR